MFYHCKKDILIFAINVHSKAHSEMSPCLMLLKNGTCPAPLNKSHRNNIISWRGTVALLIGSASPCLATVHNDVHVHGIGTASDWWKAEMCRDVRHNAAFGKGFLSICYQGSPKKGIPRCPDTSADVSRNFLRHWPGGIQNLPRHSIMLNIIKRMWSTLRETKLLYVLVWYSNLHFLYFELLFVVCANLCCFLRRWTWAKEDSMVKVGKLMQNFCKQDLKENANEEFISLLLEIQSTCLLLRCHRASEEVQGCSHHHQKVKLVFELPTNCWKSC